MTRDRAFYARIGAKGGRANVEHNGYGNLREQGAKGGNAVMAKYGKEFYSRLGKLSAETKKRARSTDKG
jgi:general stress protein YciG